MVPITSPLPSARSLSPAALDWTGRKQHSPNGVRLKEATRGAVAFTPENSRPLVKRRQGCHALSCMFYDE